MFVVGKSTDEDRVKPLDTIIYLHCTDSNCQNCRERLTSKIIRQPLNRKTSIGKCFLKKKTTIFALDVGMQRFP